MESTESRNKFQPKTQFHFTDCHRVIFRFRWMRRENQTPHSDVIKTAEFGGEGENTLKTVAFPHSTQTLASFYIYFFQFICTLIFR
jgi:hypothetical protein